MRNISRLVATALLAVLLVACGDAARPQGLVGQAEPQGLVGQAEPIAP